MKCLVLFSGTGSIEKIFSKSFECRGVDIDNHFKPFYNVDILKWDYKNDLDNWIPDYIRSSPVCKNYTPLKNKQRKLTPNKKDLDFSLSLVKKTLDIIEYVQTLNPNLKYTIENPRGYMRTLDCIKHIPRFTCNYCKYGFPYSKSTDFWSNIDLSDLKSCCNNKKSGDTRCDYRKLHGYHRVRIGYVGSFNKNGIKTFYPLQTIDSKYFKELKQQPEYKNFNDTYLRYRIPSDLVEHLYEKVCGNN